MSRKKHRKAPQDLPLLHETSVASACECTGICQTVPETEDEAQAYEDIAPVFVTPRKERKK